jgi:hypothetical protein
MTKLNKLIASLLLILLVLSVFPGCRRTDNNTYKTFTFTKGIKFSFEYSSHYYREGMRAYKPGVSVGFLDYWDKLPSDWYWYDHFNILVVNSYKSADEAIKEIVTNGLIIIWSL